MINPQAQILLFSATFPEEVMKFAERFCPNANAIKLKHEELTVAGIQQMYMDCPSEESKYDILVKLYGLMTIGSSIIFVRVCSDRQLCQLHILTCASSVLQQQR
jgi:ATP-dependent RNA helicase DDX19/DBP5